MVGNGERNYLLLYVYHSFYNQRCCCQCKTDAQVSCHVLWSPGHSENLNDGILMRIQMCWWQNVSINCNFLVTFFCLGLFLPGEFPPLSQRVWMTCYHTGLWQSFTSLYNYCLQTWMEMLQGKSKKRFYQDLVCAWFSALFIDLSDGTFELLQVFLFIMSHSLGLTAVLNRFAGNSRLRLCIYTSVVSWWNN